MNEEYKRIRVSDLAQAAYCYRRSLIQCSKTRDYSDKNKSQAAIIGTKLHSIYSPYQSWEWLRLRSLIFMKYGSTITRKLDEDIVIAGQFDDLRCLYTKDGLRVSVVEIKTTPKKFLFRWQYDAAIFQLQMYIWILKPILKDLGYTLHTRHYIEVYSQKTRRLIKRIVVKEDPLIASRIDDILCAWEGVAGMRYPEEWVCKWCPKNIKTKCSRWVSTHGK